MKIKDQTIAILSLMDDNTIRQLLLTPKQREQIMKQLSRMGLIVISDPLENIELVRKVNNINPN